MDNPNIRPVPETIKRICVEPKCAMHNLEVTKTHQHMIMPEPWSFEVEKVGVIFVWSISDPDEQLLVGTTTKDPSDLLSGIVSDHNHSIDCMD